jgi:hypothetical protein
MALWDPVRLRAAVKQLRWSNGRTTMRRFSTGLSPQAWSSCCFGWREAECWPGLHILSR